MRLDFLLVFISSYQLFSDANLKTIRRRLLGSGRVRVCVCGVFVGGGGAERHELPHNEDVQRGAVSD